MKKEIDGEGDDEYKEKITTPIKSARKRGGSKFSIL